MKLGEPLPARIKVIRGFSDAKTSRTYQLKFRGKLTDFPIHSVRLDFPKYRLNNGRTLAAQEEWLATHPNLPRDLFTRDQELDLAQEKQHEILTTMVNEAGLLKYFRTNDQEQPLVLSDKGFVINGNRRLCAMRILYQEDATKFKKFSHIDVIVLPQATDKDIYELEVELQIKPDIHSEYNWLKQAMMLRRGRDIHGYGDDDLARIHGIKKKEVQEMIQLLEYADEYLEERGFSKQYHRVQKAEYALRKLRDSKEKLKREEERAVLTKMAYIFLDNPDVGQGRLYQRIPDIQKNFEKIVQRIPKEIKVDKVAPTRDADLELLGGPDMKSVALAQAINKKENRETVLNIMLDVIEGEDRRAREFKTQTFAFRKIQEANTALQEALTTLTESSSLDGIPEQLDAVENTTKKLRQWLKDNA